MSWYFGLIVFYIPISWVLNWLLGNSSLSWAALKNEIYLWVGITILYIGAFFVLLAGVRFVLPVFVAFIAYTIVYFAISVIRKTIYTEARGPFSETKK